MNVALFPESFHTDKGKMPDQNDDDAENNGKAFRHGCRLLSCLEEGRRRGNEERRRRLGISSYLCIPGSLINSASGARQVLRTRLIIIKGRS